MEFGGRYLFGAERAAVWAALNDAALLRAVIPGCQHMAWTSPTTLDLRVKLDFGLLHPVFSGELVLSDVHPAERYTLTGRGKGIVGLAHASAEITLADAADGGTLLVFAAAGQADGGIMRLGRALIGNSAQKLIDGFFEAIGQQLHTNVTALPQGTLAGEF
ncbi:MAG: carbon monoxide dehydrogenase subunit G [Devosia sp.]